MRQTYKWGGCAVVGGTDRRPASDAPQAAGGAGRQVAGLGLRGWRRAWAPVGGLLTTLPGTDHRPRLLTAATAHTALRPRAQLPPEGGRATQRGVRQWDGGRCRQGGMRSWSEVRYLPGHREITQRDVHIRDHRQSFTNFSAIFRIRETTTMGNSISLVIYVPSTL